MKRFRGFTLIEVMIVVAIVAILGAVAYPSYLEYLKKGRRGAAQTFMMEVANRQSQFLLDNRGYAINIADLAATNPLQVMTPPDVSPFYTVKVDPTAATTPPTYTIVATPKAGTAQAADGTLTLDHTGGKTRNSVAGW